MARNDIIKKDGSLDYDRVGKTVDDINDNALKIGNLSGTIDNIGVNVKNKYGYLAQGNDWTNAIQTALNNHTIVYVPEGNYDISSTLDIPASTTLNLGGTAHRYDFAYWYAKQNKTAVLRMTQNVTAIKLHDNSTVKNGVIDYQNMSAALTAKAVVIDFSTEKISGANIDGTVLYGKYMAAPLPTSMTSIGVSIENPNGYTGYACNVNINAVIIMFGIGVYTDPWKTNPLNANQTSWNTSTYINSCIWQCRQAVYMESGSWCDIKGMFQATSVAKTGIIEKDTFIYINTENVNFTAAIWDLELISPSRDGIYLGANADYFSLSDNIYYLYKDSFIKKNKDLQYDSLFFNENDIPHLGQTGYRKFNGAIDNLLFGANKFYTVKIYKNGTDITSGRTWNCFDFKDFDSFYSLIANDVIEIEIDFGTDKQNITNLAASFMFGAAPSRMDFIETVVLPNATSKTIQHNMSKKGQFGTNKDYSLFVFNRNDYIVDLEADPSYSSAKVISKIKFIMYFDTAILNAKLNALIATDFYGTGEPFLSRYKNNILMGNLKFQQTLGTDGFNNSNYGVQFDPVRWLPSASTTTRGLTYVEAVPAKDDSLQIVIRKSDGTLVNKAVALETYGTVVPTTGTWAVGDKIIIKSAAEGNPCEYECFTAGTPGTWKMIRQKGIKKDTTANRLTGLTVSDTGLQYLDITLNANGKPIMWNGSAWVDYTGATV